MFALSVNGQFHGPTHIDITEHTPRMYEKIPEEKDLSYLLDELRQHDPEQDEYADAGEGGDSANMERYQDHGDHYCQHDQYDQGGQEHQHDQYEQDDEGDQDADQPTSEDYGGGGNGADYYHSHHDWSGHDGGNDVDPHGHGHGHGHEEYPDGSNGP
ncbi:uncharacterized protein A1O5_08871 [Cladophialophora psammophila CBS 110553]|uniref:Uncharacterized protein n=1 Tax=Cladophialophora psammophila CBS 110553 TaxID=1182543 RepID=W9WUC6_9EURO|nr:uncharacterized protein A1O5_08871 [Cladophialophora psammophila CBS 110553]EXJ68256.1 hypothetical protein A1O5_08871 [Cladophialophora psammophila CBS 110553]